MNEQEREELVAYLDGELDAETARALEARLSRDPKARAEAETLNKTWELLDYLPKPAPSTNFTNKTMDRITGIMRRLPPPRRQRPWPVWVIGTCWAAAVLLAAGVGWGASRWQADARDARTRAALEEEAARHLSAIENQALFANVDDLAFLRALDQPDLFGDDDSDADFE
jgi:anti-sigma factor RsiW